MSEILSEAELDRLGSGEWGSMRQFQVARLFASHRALQAERDELRSCNEHHKAQFLQTNAALAAMRKERDALKAELEEAAAIAEEIGPLVYDELYLQVRNSQEAKEFMLRDPRFQKAAQFLEKREAQP